MKIALSLVVVLAAFNARAASQTEANDPCVAAADAAVTTAEKAIFAESNLKNPEAGETFGGINQTVVDETDPSVYQVEYSFNDECLAGASVKTYRSADGRSCKAFARDVKDFGQPDCG